MSDKYSREQFAAKLGAKSDPKLNAAADFAARLLNGPMGDQVERIMLFGSVARDEARPDSDVDVLIASATNPQSVQQQADVTAFDVLLEDDAYIAPMVFSANDLAHPSTWFLHQVLKEGREVFRMSDTEVRRQEAQAWWALAREYLQYAELIGQQGGLRLAVDGAYNAAELAAKGMLVLRVERLPSSHGGLVQLFSREYVASGEVERMIGHELAVCLNLRGQARYNRDALITSEHVTQVATLARQLIQLLDETLSRMERQQHDDAN